MEMTLKEIEQIIYKADSKLRPLVIFARPSYVKAIKETLAGIEEKVVIRDSNYVGEGKAVVVERNI